MYNDRNRTDIPNAVVREQEIQVQSRPGVTIVKKEEIIEQPVYHTYKTYYRHFGPLAILLSCVAWILLVVWLFFYPVGGLDSRSPGEHPPQHKVSDFIGQIAANIAQIRTNRQYYFNWHPFLMCTGFLLFVVPAVILYEISPCSYRATRMIHGILNILGFICIICGFAIIIDYKNNINTDLNHFESVHGVVGFITICFFFINVLVGFMTLFVSVEMFRNHVGPFHKRMGLTVVICGLSTICIGLLYYSKIIGGSQHSLPQWTAGLIFFTMLSIIFSVPKFLDRNIIDKRLPGDHVGVGNKTVAPIY